VLQALLWPIFHPPGWLRNVFRPEPNCEHLYYYPSIAAHATLPRVRIIFFWAIPSWIVGLVLSNYVRPFISFIGLMVAFFITLLGFRLFSLRELFMSGEGVLVILAEAVAGLILTGVITPPQPGTRS
jgi:hypothetical protein